MARTFGTYSPVVPLGTTWEESFVLEDESGAAVDITNYHVRAQLHEDVPGRELGAVDPEPLLEITTASYYPTPPAWQVIEAFDVPTGTDGEIRMLLDAADTWIMSPDNTKRKFVWDIRLVGPSDYTIPLISGKVTFLPARTV